VVTTLTFHRHSREACGYTCSPVPSGIPDLTCRSDTGVRVGYGYDVHGYGYFYAYPALPVGNTIFHNFGAVECFSSFCCAMCSDLAESLDAN